jgi:GTP cyclohydrolase I
MKTRYSAAQFYEDVAVVAKSIHAKGRQYSHIYPIPQGGIPFGMALARELKAMFGKAVHILDEDEYESLRTQNQEILVVDDIADSGRTLMPYKDRCDTAVLHLRASCNFIPTYHANFVRDTAWIEYWWENKKSDIESHIVRQIEYIGEDPNREGLRETPARVVKSWSKLFGGYKASLEDVFKTFEEGACDELVILKDIEFYSQCEHHLLPFYGKAHIGYIPDGKVIGVSKLARLLEVFSRRMQIQERIGEQVTTALMEHLHPKGAICVLEAQHHCMTSRGVEKQDSVMVTSSIKGAFKQIETRAEFLSLIKA